MNYGEQYRCEESNKMIINEFFSPLKKNYATNKTKVDHIDDSWSMDWTKLFVLRPKNKNGCGYVWAITDNFERFGRIVASKNITSQTIESSFEYILRSSEIKSNLIETDDGKEFVNKIFLIS